MGLPLIVRGWPPDGPLMVPDCPWMASGWSPDGARLVPGWLHRLGADQGYEGTNKPRTLMDVIEKTDRTACRDAHAPPSDPLRIPRGVPQGIHQGYPPMGSPTQGDTLGEDLYLLFVVGN